MNVRRKINTIFFQTVMTGLLGFSLIAFSSIQIRDTISRQEETQAFVNYATLQRSDVFRLAELARRLGSAEDDSERNAIILQIESGIADFDSRQLAFREGDPTVNIIPAQSDFVLPILDNLDEVWDIYRTALLDIITNPEQIELVDIASNRATAVFVQSDRLARAANNDLAASQNQTQQTFIGIGILATITLSFLGILFYRIIGGLRSLQISAREFAKANYTIRAREDAYTELANVGIVLNQMADAVLKREQDLRNINETLEDRIQTRTAELEKATLAAQEAVRLKDEFLSVMSHELRTPLNAIMGYQGLLLLGGRLNGENQNKVQRTLVNAEQLLALINDILDISRLESNRMTYYPVEIHIHTFIDRIKARFDVVSEEKQLDFVINIDKNVPAKFLLDEDVLNKVINNLLSNAFKFTSQGQVSLDIGYTEPELIIGVKDTGIGVPSHMKDIIFEKFRQLDATTKRKYGGSGLGLSIVQNMVKELGGTVSLNSELDQGAEFIVNLPVGMVPIKS